MKASHRKLKRALLIVALCACLPVFYVLSVGPAAWVFKTFNLDDRPFGEAIRAFYSPLKIYADNHGDRFEVELLTRYLDFWQGNLRPTTKQSNPS